MAIPDKVVVFENFSYIQYRMSTDYDKPFLRPPPDSSSLLEEAILQALPDIIKSLNIPCETTISFSSARGFTLPPECEVAILTFDKEVGFDEVHVCADGRIYVVKDERPDILEDWVKMKLEEKEKR